ncbi:MAG: DUF2680 domain-containing protein [Saccharofermentanales bacterium]
MMNQKKLLTLLGVVLSIGLIGAGFTFAATASDQTSATSSETASVADSSDDPAVNPGTGRVDLNALAATLTDAQKAELAGISDEIESLRAAMIDKLAEFGVLDQDAADTIKANQAERYAQMKEDGIVFGGGRRGPGEGGPGLGHGGRGPGGNRPAAPAQTDDTTDAVTTPTIEATDSN